MTADPLRLCAAAAALAAYLAFSFFMLGLPKRSKKPHGKATWVVAYASQTGNAEALARRTLKLLQLAGAAAELMALSELRFDILRQAERVLFLVSTYGEGDPPDNAATFCRSLMQTETSLAQVHYAVLALGDSSYANYCGFGRALDARLQQLGAQPLFDRIDVNRNDANALSEWQECLGLLAGASDLPDDDAPPFASWCLARREHCNPGSLGDPVFHLELEPMAGALPHWQSGDLAQILVPGEDRAREYSIASIPADGRVHLLIRLHRRPDGSAGVASQWLCEQAREGGGIKLRLREHRRFHLAQDAGHPLILIGNGTGMAGLRAHLKARLAQGLRENWLFFGERRADADYHYRHDIAQWQQDGLRVDAVFSRDQAERRYVQDRLMEQAQALREWIARGAAIYVCGSLKGMAAGVDKSLEQVLGREALEALASSGRYRRDVY